MSDLISFDNSKSMKTSTKVNESDVKEAIEKRDQFLSEHPHLQKYQEEIDRRLNGAGSSDNRIAILSMMMREKTDELRENCISLVEVSKKMIEQIKDASTHKLRIVK